MALGEAPSVPTLAGLRDSPIREKSWQNSSGVSVGESRRRIGGKTGGEFRHETDLESGRQSSRNFTALPADFGGYLSLMRALTRLFLKLSARMLMLVVVVLWLVSWSTGVLATGDLLSRPFSVVNCRLGLAWATANAGTFLWTLETMPPLDAEAAGWVFAPSDQDLRQFDCVRPVPGMTILTGAGRLIIAVRHGLLLSVSAALWLAIEWYDRRRRRREL